MKPSAIRIERMLEKIEAALVPPPRPCLSIITHEGDDEAAAMEKALADHVARHPEDVGRTVEDFDWIGWVIVHPKFIIGADGRVQWPAETIDEDTDKNTDKPFADKSADLPLGRVRVLRDTDGDGTFDESRITTSDWLTYPILKMADVPEIKVVLLNRPEVGSYGGGSEAANALAAPAIAAALFDATGKIARRLPLKPEYVQAILKA